MPDESKPRLDDIEASPTEVLYKVASVTSNSNELLFERFTRLTEDNGHLQDELNRLRTTKATTAILDQLIVPYAARAFWFMCCYCAFSGVVVFSQILGFEALPVTVLQTLIGSSAVTVIGLVGMVLAGIFSGARKANKSQAFYSSQQTKSQRLITGHSVYLYRIRGCICGSMWCF